MLKEDELTNTVCGTPEYMAPEVIESTGHDLSVDWWAVGVLIYEMLIGVTPFFNRNKNVLQMKIKNAKVVFPDRKKYRIEYSDDIVSLIMALLTKDKSKRLGAKNGFVEILGHPYFADMDIGALEAKKITPPFMPKFGQKDLNEFFNVQQDAAAMADTFIPHPNQRIVSKHDDDFAKKFAKKNIKK